MTGLHALHMVVGIGVLLVILARTLAGSFSAKYHTPVAMAGLYWSFVDIIWVFLYALFYLQGLHT
jgi:cytochrome c oxidase subunit 3